MNIQRKSREEEIRRSMDLIIIRIYEMNLDSDILSNNLALEVEKYRDNKIKKINNKFSCYQSKEHYLSTEI